jgi:hypothetical protein
MEKIIDKINVVVFEVNSISGTISRDTDSGDDAKAFTQGAVRYIDPLQLRVFAAARQAAQRLCRNTAVRFLSGWAVPDEALPRMVANLQPIAQNVETAKAELVANWDDLLERWRRQVPSVAPFAHRFPTAAYAAQGTSAKLSVYRIHPTPTDNLSSLPIKDGLTEEVENLSTRVLQEIAADVQDTWKSGSTQATQRIRKLTSRISEKCKTLEFLGGNLGNLAGFIDEALARIPSGGVIAGADFAILASILSVLSSPERMKGISQMAADTGCKNAADSFFLNKNGSASTGHTVVRRPTYGTKAPVDVLSMEVAPIVLPKSSINKKMTSSAWNW